MLIGSSIPGYQGVLHRSCALMVMVDLEELGHDAGDGKAESDEQCIVLAVGRGVDFEVSFLCENGIDDVDDPVEAVDIGFDDLGFLAFPFDVQFLGC